MELTTQLAGGVADNFQKLITLIEGDANILAQKIRDKAAGQHIRRIAAGAACAAGLTRQLLALSRKQPQALRIVDLNPVIASICNTLPRLIGEDIEFSFVPGQGVGPVRVDPVQIEQILMNLAANARDAMPQGGHLRIETSHVHLDEAYIQHKPAAIPVGNYAVLTVSDNGSGIPREDIPHIFEPFYTTKPSGKGTGLGLATVYGIVKQNKGYIWVYSEASAGTVFKIYLPCAGKNRPVQPASQRNERVAAGTETLLLVEDEPAVRKASVEFLRLQGYKILEAKDGLEALAMAKQSESRIDLLVTDVVMPNMSGGELAKKLGRLAPEIKFLFVSGYAGKTVLDHHVLDLETNYLQKPYSLRQLAGKIRTVLESRQKAVLTCAARSGRG